jgi:hypothetical protein
MFSYVRRNMVAFVALFVAIILSGGSVAYAANTITSADIVDGQVKNQDLAPNSVGTGKIQDGSVFGADIKDNTLTGADVNESTLGPVPNADRLQGASVADILNAVRHTTKTETVQTGDCVVPGGWVACGQIPIDVPAGHTYTVTVWSSVDATTATGSQSAYSCPAITGPTCINSTAEYIRYLPNIETNVASSATTNLAAGHYIINTAIYFPDPILSEVNVNTTTTVEYYDANA